jgi:hypothetical protein
MAQFIIGGAIGLLLLIIGISILMDMINTYHKPKPVTNEYIKKSYSKTSQKRTSAVEVTWELEEAAAE